MNLRLTLAIGVKCLTFPRGFQNIFAIFSAPSMAGTVRLRVKRPKQHPQ